MTTTQKIKTLGMLRKAMSQARDDYAALETIQPYIVETMEELLTFALLIRQEGLSSNYDLVHQRMISALRGYLENEVHTAAGE